MDDLGTVSPLLLVLYFELPGFCLLYFLPLFHNSLFISLLFFLTLLRGVGCGVVGSLAHCPWMACLAVGWKVSVDGWDER